KEDARAPYTGLLYVTTSSPASSTATVVLSATIQDITATADAAGDTNFGDIRNATVTFINRDTNAPIATNLPVGLVNGGDTKTGTATYSWTVDIGNADAATYTIGVIVNNYYTRNSSTENATLDVKKPTPGSIGGGGFLINASSAGTYAGTPGAKTNFGLNVKFNKNNTNLQGNTNIIIRQTDGGGIVHVYQIKSNATDSLNITSPSAGVYKVSFTAKATVTDITNPLAPVSLGGNKNFQIMVTDNGEPGSADTIAIMLTDSGLSFRIFRRRLLGGLAGRTLLLSHRRTPGPHTVKMGDIFLKKITVGTVAALKERAAKLGDLITKTGLATPVVEVSGLTNTSDWSMRQLIDADPEVILVDIGESTAPLQIVQAVHTRLPNGRLLVISSIADPALIIELMRAGVREVLPS